MPRKNCDNRTVCLRKSIPKIKVFIRLFSENDSPKVLKEDEAFPLQSTEEKESILIRLRRLSTHIRSAPLTLLKMNKIVHPEAANIDNDQDSNIQSQRSHF